MTVVIGTAGHIDHGKTNLLRALTGIDADRLPEERRRGMTLDVGYAHLAFDDGTTLDFVDVPGHDKLVGNMLVGAGEIDAAMLVVAADDGPRAQTSEHLAILDALGVDIGIVAVTKIDAVEPGRVEDVISAVRTRLAGTSLAAAPILGVSARTSVGLEALRAALVATRDAVVARAAASPRRPASLAIDRVFTVKGRGLVVTGSLRGSALTRGATLRLVPGDTTVRVREIQVHGSQVESAWPGRTALNIVAGDPGAVHRGAVLTDDPAVHATSRVLVALHRPVADRARGRIHLGTAAVDGAIGRSGADAVDLPDGRAIAIVRLSEPLATASGDRFLLRRSGPDPVVGGTILDPLPPRGISRRRQTVARLAALAAAVDVLDAVAVAAAQLDLHGVSAGAASVTLAPDVRTAARAAATTALADVSEPVAITALRAVVARAIRRSVTVGRETAEQAASDVVDGLGSDGVLVRIGGRVGRPGMTTASDALDPGVSAAMDRLVGALDVMSPPPLAAAARAAGCPQPGVRELERTGRIALVAPDLAYAMATYRELTATALTMADRGPLTPAAFRDATGTSRKYVLALLEDLDRKGILRRTLDGHVPGPKASTVSRVGTT